MAATARIDRPAGPAATLVECDGPDAGRVHHLGVGSHRIGRAVEAELVLRDADVSRLHAELAVGTDGVRVRDLESKNGVEIDGQTLSDGAWGELRDGGRLQVGGIVLELSHAGARVREALEAGGQATYTQTLTRSVAIGRAEAPDVRGPTLAAVFFACVVLGLLIFGGCA